MPAKQAARQTRMQALQTEERTMVFHEVPHRIIHFMEDSIDCFGASRQAVIAKEITKLHETIYRDSLENILLWLKEDAVRCKGEFVVVIQGEKTDQFDSAEAKKILQILLKDHSVKEAAKLTSEIMQGSRNDIYKLAMQLKEK